MWTSSSQSRENHWNDILSCLKTCLKIAGEIQRQNRNWKGSRKKEMALEEAHEENFPGSFLSRTGWQTSLTRQKAGDVRVLKHSAQRHCGTVLQFTELWGMGRGWVLFWLGLDIVSWNVGKAWAGNTYTKNSWGFNSEYIWQVCDVGNHGSVSVQRGWRKSWFWKLDRL